MLYNLNRQEKMCLLHFSMKEREEVSFICYSDQICKKMTPITFLSGDKVHMYSDKPSLSKVFNIDDMYFIPNNIVKPHPLAEIIVDDNGNLGFIVMSEGLQESEYEESTDCEDEESDMSVSCLESENEWSISSIHARSEWDDSEWETELNA